MSKNTDISELINYVSVNGSGHVVFTTVPSAASNTDKFLVSDSGVLKFRTAAQLLSDIGAQASGNYQTALTNPVTGTGTANYLPKFVGSTSIANSLIFDNGTNVLIGTTTAPTPVAGVSFPLSVTSSAVTRIRIDSTQATPNSGFGLYASSVQKWSIAMFGTGSDFTIYNDALLASAILVKGASSNVLVGYGTSTADTGFKLDVNGTGRFSDTTDIIANNSTAINLVLRGRALDSIGQMELWNNAKSVRYGYIAAESINMSISTTQSIPLILGTNTTPRLTINGSTGAATFSSSVTATTSTFAGSGSDRVIMTRTGVGTYHLSISAANRFAIYDPAGDAERISITSGGNVGIGTNAPVTTLNISNSSHGLGLSYIPESSLPAIAGIFTNTSFGQQGYGSLLVKSRTDYAGYSISFYTAGIANDIQERMRITSGGDIGFGTNSISWAAGNRRVFEINGTTQILIGLKTGDAQKGYIFHSGTNLFLENSNSGGDFLLTQVGAGNITFSTSSAERMRITSGGQVLIGQTSASGNTNGIYFRPGIESGFIVTSDVALQLSRLSTTGDIQTFYSDTTRVGKIAVGSSTVTFESATNGGLSIASTGRIGVGESASTNSRLNVNGSTKINRSVYNWYQAGWQGNGTYWHMKTNMSAGGSGNIQYTMSLFKGYMYSYADASLREGAYGFHNWSGVIYNAASTGNLFTTVYISSDGFVVLVIPSGNGETGVTIDWHQAFSYPFVEAVVTNAKLHGSTTGGY